MITLLSRSRSIELLELQLNIEIIKIIKNLFFMNYFKDKKCRNKHRKIINQKVLLYFIIFII